MFPERTGSNGSDEYAVKLIESFADLLPLGVFLVDRDGAVAATNWAAREILEHDDGVRLVGGRLAVRGHHAIESLAKVVSRVTRDAAPGLPAVETYNISRPSGEAPYRSLIFGLAVPAGRQRPTKLGCVFISGYDGDLLPEQQWLESLFGLTHTEAKVASLLAGGASISQIMSTMGIGLCTARTHLSRVLNKTGAARQAQLVRIILRGPTSLRLPRDVEHRASS